MEIVDNFLQVTQILLKFPDLSFNLFLFPFVICCFYFHIFGLLVDDGSIFFDFFLLCFLLSHLRGDDGELFPYFFNDHLSFLADLHLLGFYRFLSFVLFLQLLDKFLCVVDFFSLVFNGFFSVFDRFLFIHDVHFQLASDNLFTADHVFNGLYCGTDFLGNLESLVFFISEGLNLLFLLLHFFPEGGAYLFFPFDLLPQIFEFCFHPHDFNVQIFCTFSIVIR